MQAMAEPTPSSSSSEPACTCNDRAKFLWAMAEPTSSILKSEPASHCRVPSQPSYEELRASHAAVFSGPNLRFNFRTKSLVRPPSQSPDQTFGPASMFISGPTFWSGLPSLALHLRTKLLVRSSFLGAILPDQLFGPASGLRTLARW